MLVRETAARQLEERRADWGYSKPVVALDIVWNLAFVFASVMMLWSRNEKPNVPIRVWIFVYAAQCLVHVVLVYVEFRRRRSGRRDEGDVEANYEDESQEEEDEEERSGVLGVSCRSRYVCGISIRLFCFGVSFIEFDSFSYAFMCVNCD